MRENPESLNYQAIELASHGEYVEAIACFKRAITMARDSFLLSDGTVPETTTEETKS